jgi:hypothetical protein
MAVSTFDPLIAARPSRAEAGDGDAGPVHRLPALQALALVERLALAHEQQRGLRHRRQVAARPDRSLLAHHWRDALVEHLDHRPGDLRPARRVPVRVHVDAARERRAHLLDRQRVADARRVVVDEVPLELLHLVVVQNLLRELADARVGAVHDLARRELLLEHRAADLDAIQGAAVEFDGLVEPRDPHQLLDRERRTVEDDRHRMTPGGTGIGRSGNHNAVSSLKSEV